MSTTVHETFDTPERSSRVITERGSDISGSEDTPFERPKEEANKPKRKYNTEATAWRRRPNGTCNNTPLDPNYYNKYVMTPVRCPLCRLMTRRGHITDTNGVLIVLRF